MQKYLCCDWGTSSFRLLLVEKNEGDFRISREEVSANGGIKEIYSLWEKEKKKGTKERINFYLNILDKYVKRIAKVEGELNKDIPIIISGMASSSIGIQELPYKKLPFNVDGSGLKCKFYKKGSIYPHPIFLISGISATDNDVIRGEETQLIGAFKKPTVEETLFLFPGTHSKHIRVSGKETTSFKTFLTGEVFNLLIEHSILKTTLEKPKKLILLNFFKLGVHQAKKSNFLNNLFRVRSNVLFNKLSKKENYFYLSGLVIGTELREINDNRANLKRISLIGSDDLQILYYIALKELKVNIPISRLKNGNEITARGQIKIYEQNK